MMLGEFRLTLNEEAHRWLARIAMVSGRDEAETVRYALLVFERCLKEHLRGNQVFIREPDGKQTELVGFIAKES